MNERSNTAVTVSAPCNSQTNLEAFIADAKRRQPYVAVAWQAMVWDITEVDTSTRAHLRSTKSLFFTEHAGSRVVVDQRKSFASPFADLCKACITMRRVDRGVGSGPQRVFMRAARYVYGACPLPVRWDTTLLTREHFVRAEKAALAREKASSAYRVGQFIEQFARLVDRHGLARADFDFRSAIPRPQDLSDRTSTEFEDRVKGLPSSEVLDALAVIANDGELKKRPFDLLRVRITELLLVCGFRVGEVLTLPANTLVRELVLDEGQELRRDPVSGEPIERIGLRYWPEKGGEPVIKWIPTVANPLILRAVADIDKVCSAARRNARWLEEHPGKVNLPIGSHMYYTMREALKLQGRYTGSGGGQFANEMARRGLTLTKKGRALQISGYDLMRFLSSQRYDQPALVRDNGRVQTLSGSLLTIFLNESHSLRATREFISVPVSWQHMSGFLGGYDQESSIFERYGCYDENGRGFRIKTHDFRKFVNTMAQRGGLSQIEIARWMGRRRIDDNKAYDYRTAAQMAVDMRKLVENNEVYGTIADQVKMLPETERGAFLESRLAMVHTTPHGQCASNIGESSCATAISCLGGCLHYMRRKGDAASRTRLLAIERETLVVLQKAREARDQGKHNAQNWVNAQETVLQTVRAALAIDEDASITDGAVRPVNPDGAVLGEPL